MFQIRDRITGGVQAVIPGGGGEKGGGHSLSLAAKQGIQGLLFSVLNRMCFLNGKLQKVFCCFTGILYANNIIR